MLSGETSVGHYPVRCVEVLDSIAHRMERSGNLNFAASAILNGDRQKATKAAISLADSVENACMVIFTRRGLAARRQPSSGRNGPPSSPSAMTPLSSGSSRWHAT